MPAVLYIEQSDQVTVLCALAGEQHDCVAGKQ